jgi:hypothetical protein
MSNWSPPALPVLRQIPSPNFSERAGSRIDLIVIHDTEGGYASAVSWFANRHSQVSAHIVLKENGSEATQMVPFAKKAWHACDYNSRSIGLEMAGFAKAGYGEPEWTVAADIVAWLLHKYQIPAVWAQHGEGPGFCSHYDLGAAGGGHSDPTTDGAIWAGFVGRVQGAFARGFLPEWGQHEPAPPAPTPA